MRATLAQFASLSISPTHTHTRTTFAVSLDNAITVLVLLHPFSVDKVARNANRWPRMSIIATRRTYAYTMPGGGRVLRFALVAQAAPISPKERGRLSIVRIVRAAIATQ